MNLTLFIAFGYDFESEILTFIISGVLLILPMQFIVGFKVGSRVVRISKEEATIG